MLKQTKTNALCQPIKIREICRYLILLLLVLAISLPAAILPSAGPVQATEPLPVPWLYAPYDGYITNDNTVDLIWSDVDPPRAFEYQVDNNPDFSSPEVDATEAEFIPSYLWRNITVRAYTATTRALTDGTYYWRVRTYLGSEYGNWTETWRFTVDTVPTAAPGLVSPANGSIIAGTFPELRCNAPAGVARFEWQVANNAGFSPLYSSDYSISVIYNFPSPIPCNHYYWRVRAIDMAGNISAWSPTWNFWLLYPPDLPSPANGSYVNTLTPTITWNAVPGDAMSYQLQVDNQSDFSSPNTNAYWITQNSYTTVTLTEGTTYYWRVRSHQDTATSAWSPVWHFTPDTTPPAMPALVSPSNGATTFDTNPTLDWNPVSGAATYEWQISTAPAFISDPVNPNSTTASEYTFPSSLPYDTYYWRVRARDAAGNAGRWSAIWSFTTIPGSTALTVTPVSGPHDGTVSLSATLTKTGDGSPIAGKIIVFKLNGAIVGAAITNASGVATLNGVSLSGNPTGTYPAGIKAVFAGDALYDPIIGVASLSILIASLPPFPGIGQGATGGGWYTLEDRGRVNFSFNVNPIPNTDPIKYKGEILIVNEDRWRLKGTLNFYRYSGSRAEAVGSGQLYYWDSTLKKGHGDWVKVLDFLGRDTISFGINFYDVNTGKAKDSLDRDKFGISISIDIPPGAPPLPNSSPAILEGGNIDIKGINHNEK